MKNKIGVVMDPIENIWVKYDGTLKLMLEMQKRDCEIFYILPENLFWQEGRAYALTKILKVYEDEQHWFDYLSETIIPLDELNIIFMRKDPPFNMNYIYATYFLEQAEKAGVLVINSPQALRDANEKFFITHFPQCIASTMVSSNAELLKQFHQKYGKVVFKPLDSMAGKGIFIARENEDISQRLQNLMQPLMVQQYIPEVVNGDKRIFILNGEPLLYVLARFPESGDILDASREGTIEKPVEFTARDQWICQQIGLTLKAKGLLFVGIDIIGDYLTEINVTSPGIITEMSMAHGVNIAEMIVEKLLGLLSSRA
jgi:glutathione synthase